MRTYKGAVMNKTTTIWIITACLSSLLLIGCDNLKVDNAPASSILDGETAAIVNGEPLYVIDVELEAVAQGLIAAGERFGENHEQYQNVLDQLIDQRLLAQEAVNRNLDLDTTARHRLAIARERILGNLLIESLVTGEVTEDTIRQMYSEQVRLQQLEDEVRISLITVPDKATANAVIKDYKGGAEFSALAFKYSTDATTRIEGGDLGYIGPAEQPEPFASTIANTSVGKISDAFQSDSAWHVLKVEDRRQRAPETLEEMRPRLVTFLTYSEINKILRELRIKANITAPDAPEETDRSQLLKIDETEDKASQEIAPLVSDATPGEPNPPTETP